MSNPEDPAELAAATVADDGRRLSRSFSERCEVGECRIDRVIGGTGIEADLSDLDVPSGRLEHVGEGPGLVGSRHEPRNHQDRAPVAFRDTLTGPEVASA